MVLGGGIIFSIVIASCIIAAIGIWTCFRIAMCCDVMNRRRLEEIDRRAVNEQERIEKKYIEHKDRWITDIFVNTTDEQCVICLNSLKENTILVKCHHKFHLNCIKKWELVSSKEDNPFLCPLCNQNLYSEINGDISIQVE